MESIRKVNLFYLLLLIDTDLAECKREETCPFRGSPLHYSNYARKPRGGPDSLPEKYLIRHSLCCSNEGCRRRTLPLSLRFWDRRVYFGGVMRVVMTLHHGRTGGYSTGKPMKIFGISRNTLKRWKSYFGSVFPLSSRWRKVRGRIGIVISNEDLPAAVVSYFSEQFSTAEKGLTGALRFLSGGLEPF